VSTPTPPSSPDERPLSDKAKARWKLSADREEETGFLSHAVEKTAHIKGTPLDETIPTPLFDRIRIQRLTNQNDQLRADLAAARKDAERLEQLLRECRTDVRAMQSILDAARQTKEAT
jgi:hypothetical protein